jgi:hypothetical protein
MTPAALDEILIAIHDVLQPSAAASLALDSAIELAHRAGHDEIIARLEAVSLHLSSSAKRLRALRDLVHAHSVTSSKSSWH